ncbi:unnamed protein product, partial [Meganyctiphanes norvegica]
RFCCWRQCAAQSEFPVAIMTTYTRCAQALVPYLVLLLGAQAHPQSYNSQNAQQVQGAVGCPAGQGCVPFFQCQNGFISTDGAGLLDLRSKVQPKTSQCVSATDPTTITVCCGIPGWVAPVVVQPQVSCPNTQRCVEQALCDAQGYIRTDGAGIQDVRIVNNNRCPLVGNQYQGSQLSGVCCNPPLPQAPTTNYVAAGSCGFSNSNVGAPVEYNEAAFGQFPWQAVIFFSNFTFKCGGSIIGDRWILTAAHCVHGFNPYDFKIRVGEWQVNSFDEPLPYQDVDIINIFTHPQFNPRNVHNDFAVLELKTSLVMQYHINSICLPNPNQYFWGKRCVSTGWGKDAFNGNYQNILKRVDLPLVEDYQCQSLLRRTRLGEYFNLDDSFICAGGEENKDACKGDGGGPLACQDGSGRYVLSGITAFGIGCGNKDVPGVYADVAAFVPWITNIINGGGNFVQSQPQQQLPPQQQYQPPQQQQQQNYQPPRPQQQQQQNYQPPRPQQQQNSNSNLPPVYVRGTNQK